MVTTTIAPGAERVLAAHGTTTAAPAPARPARPARPAPGLTVLAGTDGTLPLAGYLLRHGPAITLVESAPDAVAVGASMGGFALPLYDLPDQEARREEAAARALTATAAAGFDVHAVEVLPSGDLADRLERLRGRDVACVVVATPSARRARRLARAAGAPVLVLPARGGAAAGGPAVVPAEDAGQLAFAAARALATERAVVVAGDERERSDDAGDAPARARAAARLAGEHGLEAEPVVAAGTRAVLATAAEREGLLVVADRRGWRPPALLRSAIAARRPVLLVPAAQA